MTLYKETRIKIDFNNCETIAPVVVFEGVVINDGEESFNKDTHEIEELLTFINEWEYSGCDVFV
jgi:hypothetical protein